MSKAVGADRLGFLGCTGHDGNHHCLLPVRLLRVMEIFLNDCGKHSHGGTAGGNIGNKILVLVCDKFHPRRTAGCKKRKILSRLQSLQEFRGFFHNGQVGAEAGVVYLIEAHPVKGVNDLTHDAASFGLSVVISHRHADRRSDLRHNAHVGIGKSLPHLVHMSLNGNSSSGTVYTALSAVNALGLRNLLIERGHYHSVRTAVRESQRADSLEFLAGAHAVAAEDTFIGITHDRG